MEKEHIRNILALSLIKGIGATSIKKSFLFVEAFAHDWMKLAKMNAKVNQKNLFNNFSAAEAILSRCEKTNIQVVSIIDEEYPQKLLELKDPPPILYYRGNLSLANRAIGIIGEQRSSSLGNAIAQKLGAYFHQEWAICNGLNYGVEQAAVSDKEGAVLSKTIGVLTSGLNNYSRNTQVLAEKIVAANGLLLSEYEPDQAEDEFSGNKSSRIIAGISYGLMLVQSKIDGIAKYPLRAFCGLVRPLGVIEFASNQEYTNHDLFSANRLILEKHQAGLLEFCVAKKVKKMLTKDIISISNKEDYQEFEALLLSK